MGSYSFDVVSEVDAQEVINAVNQAQREVTTRYDLQGSNADIEYDKKNNAITLTANDELKLNTINEILLTRMVKRSVPTKSLVYGKVEPTGRLLKKEITLQQGLSKDQCKEITQHLKKTNKKLQAQVMGEQVRVTGKSKDDLQEAMQACRSANFNFDVQFTNYR